VALRYVLALVPLALMAACSGSSTSQDPGGGSGASAATGATGGTGTGGAGGSTTGSGGSDGVGARGGAGGTGGTGGVGASGGEGAIGGSRAVGGSGAMGASGGVGGSAGAGGTDTCGEGGCVPDLPGEPIEPPGPVYCGGVECAGGNACCIANGECFDPARNPEACPEPPPDDADPWGRKPCTSNSHCSEREFCQMDTPTCQGTGHCQPRTNCGSCGGECVLCGCDGNTYPDIQTACLAGANAFARAACGETVETGGGGSGGSGGELPVRIRTYCANTEQCPSGETCCPRLGFCLADDDPYLCGEPPAGTLRPCLTDDHCDAGSYCLGEGCSGPGGCVYFGSQGDCGVRLEPVCGCNGVSYTSAACASTEGTRVRAEGQCPAAE
jgi:hypothetical protein